MTEVDLQEELTRTQEELQRVKEDFRATMYAASHDVKEMLRGVGAYTQLLVRDLPENPELKELAFLITSGVREAAALLDRMNAFARIESAPKTTLKLNVVAQLALMKLYDRVRDASVEVVVDDMPEATVTEGQLSILLENLIDNALKYRTKGGKLRIEIAAEEQDDGVLIQVRDNGPGIESQYHKLIFEPFKRLHGRDIPGTGLGLAICRKIAHAHAGKIWVESDGQNGSAFKVFLPF